jgi:hypothetical protein
VELGAAAVVVELRVLAAAVAGLDVAAVAPALDVAQARGRQQVWWRQAWEERAWRFAEDWVEGISSRPVPSRGTGKPRVRTAVLEFCQQERESCWAS